MKTTHDRVKIASKIIKKAHNRFLTAQELHKINLSWDRAMEAEGGN